MKRILVLALAAMVTACSWAQGTFTIRRPVDGSTVRETVKVRIPKNSIPDGGYIGIYVNGKFLEATLPEIEGDDYVYNLDTQARKLDDGPTKIECVLFADVNGKAQVVNRSSVNVTVDNHTSIKVPEDGFKLRYKWSPGTEHVYDFSFNEDVGMISQAQAAIGGRAPTVSSNEMKLRILYATDNAYKTGDGTDGLLRIQILPDKGKDYAMALVPGEDEPRKLTDDDFVPFFMRVTDVGREVFSSLPVYFGIEGQTGAAPAVRYWPTLPLPVLPTKLVKPGGDPWQSSFLFTNVDATTAAEKDKFMFATPARGEFQGVTWYRDMPCAIIKTVVAVGPDLLKNAKDLNQVKGDASNVKLEGTIYFALDRGVVARMEVDLTQESLVDTGPTNQGGGASGGSTGGPSAGPTGGPSRAGTSLGGGGSAASGKLFIPGIGQYDFQPGLDSDGNLTFFQARGQRGGRGGAMPGGGAQLGGGAQPGGGTTGAQPGGRFGTGRGESGPTGNRKMVLRFRMSYVAELER